MDKSSANRYTFLLMVQKGMITSPERENDINIMEYVEKIGTGFLGKDPYIFIVADGKEYNSARVVVLCEPENIACFRYENNDGKIFCDVTSTILNERIGRQAGISKESPYRCFVSKVPENLERYFH